MKAYPSQLAERFQVRMPTGMRDMLRARARANHRSVNSEIVIVLEEALRASSPVNDGGAIPSQRRPAVV